MPRKSATKVSLSKKPEEERKSALRIALVKRREEIVKEAKSEISKYIRGETRQLVDTALDDGDWSVVDLSEDISLQKLSSHRETLLKIDEALRKLQEGTYGKCEDCGEEISEERLNVLPFAIYCRDCQEKIEFLEAIERKERIK
jgi:DnaK suppressor protein